MGSLIFTFLAAFIGFFALFFVISAITKKRRRLAHEKLDESYIYRKEPHADQLTQMPNKLKGNEVTKG